MAFMHARKSATSLASLLNSPISSRVKRGCDKGAPRPDGVPNDVRSNIALEDEQAASPATEVEVSKKRLRFMTPPFKSFPSSCNGEGLRAACGPQGAQRRRCTQSPCLSA